MLAAVPLLAIVVGLYHVVALTGAANLTAVLYEVPLLSGALFAFSIADLLLAGGLILLYLEIFKATRTGNLSIVDHLFSMLLFVLCLVELIALPGFGTSVFFLLTLMTFIDVIAGFTVTISTARRDIGVDQAIGR